MKISNYYKALFVFFILITGSVSSFAQSSPYVDIRETTESIEDAESGLSENVIDILDSSMIQNPYINSSVINALTNTSANVVGAGAQATTSLAETSSLSNAVGTSAGATSNIAGLGVNTTTSIVAGALPNSSNTPEKAPVEKAGSWIQNKMNKVKEVIPSNKQKTETELQVDLAESEVKVLKAKEKLEKHQISCQEKTKKLEDELFASQIEVERVRLELQQYKKPEEHENN